jgi:two-component system, cell cycle sensor histidine kinase and response regulator CckA
MARGSAPFRALEQQLSEAQSTIAALLSDQIDAVYDLTSNTPVLLGNAQQALRESEERAQHYLDSATVMLVALDVDGRIVLVNRYACSVLGGSAADLIGRDWVTACIPPRLWDATRVTLRDIAAGDASVVENSIVTATGEERLVEWRSSVRRDSSGAFEGTLSSGIDITERRRLEARHQQASKMEAVGQLASGVAHDFNNLLTVIIGFAELAIVDDTPDASHVEELKEILSAARSATGLTRQLLAFSRQQVLRAAPLDVNELIEHMTGMLRRLIGEHIEIEMSLAPHLALAHADRGQLEQVIMNLVVNARDAMPDGGRVKISTLDVAIDERSFPDEAVLPGSYVMVAIADTGTGMGEETHRRLFEPFFTTKEAGKGTGLGLSTTYGIVKQSKGYIGVETALGKGTTFRVYLPQGVTSAPDEEEPVKPVTRPGRARETVLLVEDEAGVRRLSRRILETAGYHVLVAANGDEAERLFAEAMKSSGSVDLLVTDIIMPHCGGPELFRRLHAKAPTLRVLYMSGYTNQSSAQQAEIDAGLPFVQKPFTAREFKQRVRESLQPR